MGNNWSGDQDEGEEEYPPASARRRQTAPARTAAPARTTVRPAGPATTVAARRASTRAAAPKRDTFPLAVSAVVVVLLLGLMGVFLANNNNNTNNNTPSTTLGGGAAATVPAQGAVAPTAAAASGTVGPTEEPAPRMALADFKKLYDDPKTRPLILDVRAKDAFDAGHIDGAISFPESDVDTRVGELPKDKLIVAYCQ